MGLPDEDWSYDETKFGGPSRWRELQNSPGNFRYPTCRDGVQQSPIDLASVELNPSLAPLTTSWAAATNFSFSYSRRAFSISLTENFASVADPNSGENYDLTRIDLHAPSEHLFSGSRVDMEIQFVHKPRKFVEGGSTAIMISVGFIAKPLGPTNAFLDGLVGHMPNPLPQRPTSVRGSLEIGSALPSSRNYFTYQGSESMPPCAEGVRWYVMEELVALDAGQLRTIVGLLSAADIDSGLGGNSLTFSNSRSVQPLNSRVVHWFNDGAPLASADLGPAALTLTGRLSIAAIVISGLSFLALIAAFAVLSGTHL
jgi:carbonic anhydrase